MGITAYIPVHPEQESSMISKGEFVYRGDHLICSQGKRLTRVKSPNREGVHYFVARQIDCQVCPVQQECLPRTQKRRYVSVTKHYPAFLKAQERNRTEAYRREHKRRQLVAEGTFASLDRLSRARSRLRRLWKVDCEGYMAGLAHNVLKAIRRLRDGAGPTRPLKPRAVDPVPPVAPKEYGIPAYPVNPSGTTTTAESLVTVTVAL